MVQTNTGQPFSYWDSQIPDTADVCDRLAQILMHIKNWEGKTYPNGYGIESIARKPKIAASLTLAMMDLDKEPDVAVDGSSLYSYVRFSHNRRYPPRDSCSSLVRVERFFSVYLFYPIRANEEGGVAHQILEAIANVVDSGFTAWSVKRAFPAIVHSTDTISTDSNWTGIEIQLCVPYNTGYMDNQDIVELGKGESFDVEMDVKFTTDEQGATIRAGYFGTETITVYNGTDRSPDSFTPNAPTSATTEGFVNSNPQWIRNLSQVTDSVIWQSLVTFNKFFRRTNGEVQFNTTTGQPIIDEVFVSSTAPTLRQ